MRKVKFFSFFFFAIIAFALQSCVKESDYFQEPTKKAESSYFDFTTIRTIKLNLNYGFIGHTALFEVFIKNESSNITSPIKEEVILNKIIKSDSDTASLRVKLNATPIYKAFTSNNCNFSGDIEVPSYVNKIYVYSETLGVPRCVEVNIQNNEAIYVNSITTRSSSITSRAMTSINIGNNRKTIDAGYKLYSLYDTYTPARGKCLWEPSNSVVKDLYSIVTPETQLSNESTFGELMSRVDKSLTKRDNSNYIVPEKNINISIISPTSTGNTIDGARLDLVLLNNHANMHSSMAYYYYKTGRNLSANELKALPKYVVIPRMMSSAPDKHIKARLQYFGENGNQSGTDLFPPGYTIGFVLITDLFPNDGNAYFWTDLSYVESRMEWAYGVANQYVYTNQSANYKQKPGCISLYDEKSKKIIIGFEDQTFREENDNSFEDVLFYVDADPIESVMDPTRPTIPTPPGTLTYATETTKGTLAFEDIWPSGGDYDMNDVVVQYETTITFNSNNKITKIVDTFTPINDGANYIDAFGYVINNNLGTIDLSKSNFYSLEESNQIILFANAKEAVANKQKCTIVRDFPAGIDKVQYKRDYNPFIVPNYKAGVKNRTEVHLPKNKPTSWVDTSLVGTKDDAYYINKDGSFPFAIDLPVSDFKPVTEGVRIGTTNEYGNFTKWTKSFGKENANWYLNK